MVSRCFVHFILLVPLTSAKASNYRVSQSLNNTFWTFGVASTAYDMRSATTESLSGNSIELTLGKGLIREKWLLQGSLQSIGGPLNPFFDNQLEMYFSGLGVTCSASYSVLKENIRSDNANSSLTFGLNYTNLSGISLGKNKKLHESFDSTANNDLIDNYKFKNSTLNLLLGFTVSSISKARPLSNRPDLMKTKLEGVSLNFIIQIPLHSKMTSESHILDFKGESQNERRKKSSKTASMKGHSLSFGVTTVISS